jgi:hypothetical protein
MLRFTRGLRPLTIPIGLAGAGQARSVSRRM